MTSRLWVICPSRPPKQTSSSTCTMARRRTNT
nr:MAG TPA: hypothetical protein [Caudoviricetes sp.]